jgi:hypothetical protein
MRATTFLVIAAVPALVHAQAYFELSSGELHEGRLGAFQGDSRLDTAIGRLALDADTKVMRRDPFGSREAVVLAADGLHADNAAGQLAVARFAAERGVWTAARSHLNRALQLDPDSGPALALAASWAARFQMNEFEAGPKPNVRKALEAWIKEGASRDWVGAAMVEAKTRPLDDALLLHPMLKALKTGQPPARWCAARVLSRLRSDPERIKPLYRRGVLDPSAVVRIECVRALKVTKDPVFCRLFGKSLASGNQAIRIAAAEALAELEIADGAEPLVRLLAGEDPVAPRNHIASTTQVAYVKDYDVEVAQGAVIADPVVDIVQEGVIHDFAVVSVTAERKVYFGALRRITKRDFGQDVGKWKAYVESTKAKGAPAGS